LKLIASPAEASVWRNPRYSEMKTAATVVLTAVAILALIFLMMGVLGVSFGVRVGGNLFADQSLGSVRPAHLLLLIFAAVGGLYILWRGRRRTR